MSREITIFESKQWDWGNVAESDAQVFALTDEVEKELVNIDTLHSQPSDTSIKWTEISHNSAEGLLNTSSSQSSSASLSLASIRYQSLANIYSCSFALTAADPTTFEEGSKHKE